LVLYLIYAQATPAFDYQLGVGMGTQESAEAITEVGACGARCSGRDCNVLAGRGSGLDHCCTRRTRLESCERNRVLDCPSNRFAVGGLLDLGELHFDDRFRQTCFCANITLMHYYCVSDSQKTAI
jgi:hypothetical protein